MKNRISFISPDIEHRYVKKLGEEFLDIEFTKDYDKIRKSTKPVIMWNPYGYLAYQTEIYKKKYDLYQEYLQENRDVYIVERGALPNTIFIEKNYFNIESSSYNENNWNRSLSNEENQKTEDYISWLKTEEHTLEPQQNSRLSSSELLQQLNIDREDYEQIIFVPLQIHNDTVTLLWCDWVKDTTTFNTYIYRLAQLYPKALFLIKNHPNEENTYKIPQELSNLKIVDKFHYKDCLDLCDKVITINSGIGLQAMCWKKPVAICGKAFYCFDDINLKINNFEELKTFIKFRWIVNYEKVKRFIHYLINEFYTECTMQKVSRQVSSPKLIQVVRLPKDCISLTELGRKLKILYLFNEYGWAFEFEAKNYEKYSRHNIIPFHYNPLRPDLYDSDYKKISDINPDIVVFPSAWHYHKIAKNYIKKIKEQNIKIVVQVNSHYEINYFCQYADLVMCSSQKLYDIVTQNFSYENIVKQHHFVDTERFKSLRIPRTFILGWAGRFDNPVKQGSLLLKLGYPILIKSNYHSFLKENRSHDEMLDFYKKISCLLITSKHEGSPYPTLEAMACGRPIITTDVGIAKEILPSKCIVEGDSEEEIIQKFQQKIDKLKKNSSLIRQLGKRNKEYIKQHLSWNSHAHELDELYNSLIQKETSTNTILDGAINFREVLFYIIKNNLNCWLINESCLDAIRYCKLSLQENILQIAGEETDILKLKEFLFTQQWKLLDENQFCKNKKYIQIETRFQRPTKVMDLFGIDVNVPYPVITYLKELYGKNWQNYEPNRKDMGSRRNYRK